MKNTSPKEEGVRERKRRETLQRIAETGLQLFVKHGYDATTLETIAEASGISRRTFFYYFKSKEEIVLAWQRGLAEALRSVVLEQSTKQPPLEAVKNALLKLTARYHSDKSIMIDKLMRSNEALAARTHAKYVESEQAVFEALCIMWPEPKRRKALRAVAMMSIGAMRLALDAWGAEEGKRPLSAYLRDSFANLKAEL
ncbi:helix-turn-helix domain containing protein [Bradyrhizobium sp. Arg237L]|uniref:TetR/AcrR family transcriptional regulator n=1 Tax=Bradyrhizobium sp. Arg237L TaxID=3003352 RepID=UPI00249EDC07|nr:TetR/AcrR family transcriptional regulator [Bradyrhizobium sp. Arg237L]MDI4233542.1 helix-turn-helix domain containing protein [Bradyrhizobium sp. Arg237L]